MVLALFTTMTNTSPKKYLTVRLDDDLLQALAAVANQNERSASSEARLAIRLYLEHFSPATLVAPRKMAVGGDSG